jgi:tRNA(adenine34) deaminase
MGVAESDLAAMRLALAAAGQGAAAGEVPVGAIVMRHGEVIASAHNTTIGESDPAGHAELVALRAAAAAVGNHRIGDATLFVTLEPCVMCLGAIAHARIDRLVFGAYDKKAGAAGSAIDLSDSRALNHRFEINGGVMETECAALLQAFFAARR